MPIKADWGNAAKNDAAEENGHPALPISIYLQRKREIDPLSSSRGGAGGVMVTVVPFLFDRGEIVMCKVPKLEVLLKPARPVRRLVPRPSRRQSWQAILSRKIESGKNS
jgi:hypothetical protein